jgi:ABC-type uncharacterized transport system permease subunit
VAEGLLVYLRLAAAAVRADSGRPLFLALRTVAAGMIVAVEVMAVVLLLDRFGTIGGWRAPEVVLLFGLAFASRAWRWRSATGWRPTTCRCWSASAPSTRC